jgi:hypothetical protein
MPSPKSRRTGAGIGGDSVTDHKRFGKTDARTTTMAELTGSPGFAPKNEKTLARRRAAAIELIATVGLTISLVVAATAVSLGNRSFTRGEFIDRGSAQAPVGALLDQADAFGQMDTWLALKAPQ